MDRREISKAIFASATGTALLSQTAQAQTCTAACYPQTAAETAAIAAATAAHTTPPTPVNLTYPPLYVDRYGTNTTPGTTSMTQAFQAAVNVAKLAGGVVQFGATAPYLLDGPLNLTKNGQPDEPGYVIRGVGPVGPDAPGALIARHTGYVFDCTGADSLSFENISLHTDSATYPQVCFFFARNNSGAGSVHRISNCRIFGKFSKSIYYNYGAECDVLTANYFANFSTDANSKVCAYTSYNSFGLASSWVSIATGQLSCIDHQILGGQYMHAGGQSTQDVFYFDAIRGFKCFGVWAACSNSQSAGGSPGRSLVYTNMTNGPSGSISFFGLQMEASLFPPPYAFTFSNNAGICSNWTIAGAVLYPATTAFNAPALVDFLNLTANGWSVNSGNGIAIAGTLTGSYIQTLTTLSIANSKQNMLMGQSSNWTIANRQQDYWIDLDIANKSWSAVTTNLTVSGGITNNRGRMLLTGSKLEFNLLLVAGSSLSCGAGTVITGLPVTAVDYSADLHVSDPGTGLHIGSGHIVNGNLYLPAVSPRQAIVVSGSYFVA